MAVQTKARKVTRLRSENRGRSAYRVDLPAYHADCDANYLRLCKLLPQLAERQQWRYRMPHGSLELEVVERSRYTTEVNLSALSADDQRWLALPCITVRLYHDAQMAEVVAVDGKGPLGEKAPGVRHTGAGVQEADERQQANRFLGEWLGHCLANGRVEFELVLDGRQL